MSLKIHFNNNVIIPVTCFNSLGAVIVLDIFKLMLHTYTLGWPVQLEILLCNMTMIEEACPCSCLPFMLKRNKV